MRGKLFIPDVIFSAMIVMLSVPLINKYMSEEISIEKLIGHFNIRRRTKHSKKISSKLLIICSPL